MFINKVGNHIEYKGNNVNYTKKILKLSKSHNIMDTHRSNRKYCLNTMMTNNIADEIKEIRKRQQLETIDYMKIYDLNQHEYRDSLSKIKSITEEINEAHITSIIAIKKLFSTNKHIFELFSYLCTGDLVFDWRVFRNELNFYDTKFKMSGVIDNIMSNVSYKILCNILNKVTKDKNFCNAYLEDKEIGIYLIFRWIREVLKVYFYLEKEKRKNEIAELQNRQKFNQKKSALNIKKKQKTHINKLKLNLPNNDNNRNILYNQQSPKVSNEKNSSLLSKQKNNLHKHYTHTNILNNNKYISTPIENSVYLTNLNNNNNSNRLSPNLKNPNKRQINTPQFIKEKEYHLNYDVTEHKLSKDKKNILFLPLIKYKNFHELKKFYNLNSKPYSNKNSQEIQNKHYEDLSRQSIKTPYNTDKLVSFLSFNRINIIDDKSIQNFILFNDDEYNDDKMKLEIRKKNILAPEIDST